MESAWVRPLEPPREQRQKPTSKLHGNYINSHENDYESFAKTMLEAISSFSFSNFEKKEDLVVVYRKETEIWELALA